MLTSWGRVEDLCVLTWNWATNLPPGSVVETEASMAEFGSQTVAEAPAPGPTPTNAGYPQVGAWNDMNSIPHHRAVESVEDGKKHGRLYFGALAKEERAA